MKYIFVYSLLCCASAFYGGEMYAQNVSRQAGNTQENEELIIVLRDRSVAERLSNGKFHKIRSSSNLWKALAKFSISDEDISPLHPQYIDPFADKDTAFIVQHPQGYNYVTSNSASKMIKIKVKKQHNIDMVIEEIKKLPEISSVEKDKKISTGVSDVR